MIPLLGRQNAGIQIFLVELQMTVQFKIGTTVTASLINVLIFLLNRSYFLVMSLHKIVSYVIKLLTMLKIV